MMLVFFFFNVSFKLQAKEAERQKHKSPCELFITLFCRDTQTNAGGIGIQHLGMQT